MTIGHLKRRALTAVLGIAAVLAFAPAPATAKSCARVVNPYEGTQYEGVDLSHIEAKGVKCSKARRVAKRAHRKGLAMAPSPDGYLQYRSKGWDVSGNLRPASDRYVATKDGKRVRWRF